MDFLSPSNEWAAPGSGKVLHWEGVDWTLAGEPAGFLDTVEVVSANDVWAAGDGIFHWNGATWNESADNTLDVRDIDMLSYNNGWAVGNGICCWDGRSPALPYAQRPHEHYHSITSGGGRISKVKKGSFLKLIFWYNFQRRLHF